MARAACSDEEFIDILTKYGPTVAAQKIGTSLRSVNGRRVNLERKYKRQITFAHPRATRNNIEHPERVYLEIANGIVLVGSDGHYWPGDASVAHRAFVKLIKELGPSAVIMNGDAFDGARVSRHPPIGWENRPTVVDEVEVVKERLHEIEMAAARGVPLVWPLGNHDGRFETRLASVAPEYAKIHGFHLKDHVGPRWEPCWSAWINAGTPGHTVVKHRYRGGEHSGHNNALRSGVHMVTGHDHALKATPFTDYRGTRWGVGCGCLSDPFGEQFTDYTEDNPRNHRAGFAVLTYNDGYLLPPELVHVCEHEKNSIVFRGEVIRV